FTRSDRVSSRAVLSDLIGDGSHLEVGSIGVGSRSEDSKLETLIATYDIPLDLRPRLPDPNFRMINLPDGDTTIGGATPVSNVWRNPTCDPVLRHTDNTVSIYDFLCMPSLDGVAIREEPHGLDTSLLDRVADHTTTPTPLWAAIPRATPEETAVTRPDRKTKVGKKGSEAGSSRQAAGGGVEQVDDGTLDDGDQGDDTEFAAEDIESFNDVSQGEHINVIPLRTFNPSIGLDVTYPPILLPDKEVEPHTKPSEGTSEDASHRVQGTTPTLDTQPQDANDNRNGSNDNVEHYYKARVGNIVGDVIDIDLLPPGPGPNYITYPYDEGSNDSSPSYTKDDWEEIHGVNLDLPKKELYKDPKERVTMPVDFSWEHVECLI
ncbi:hypothetical protein Tco_0945898, partial [Tanacetum coccineum]